jgi:hypothetical protein
LTGRAAIDSAVIAGAVIAGAVIAGAVIAGAVIAGVVIAGVVIAGVLIAGDPGLSPVDETRFPTDIADSWCPRHVVRAIQIRLPSPVEGPPDPPGRRKDRIYAELHRNGYALG